MEWDWNEVDGVTTLSAPAGAIQGPLQAGLMFGVGRVDETMTVAGITHAVEHLAFQPLGHRPYGLNGSVSSVCTRFVVVGEPDDVVEFYGAITRNLSELPLDGLEHELEVLRVEEQQRSGSQIGHDLSERFGPNGAGLIGWPEHGLKRVGPDDVRAWAHTWFTRRNAALWTSGPLPARLDLSALPLGDAPTRAAWRPSLPPPRSFAVAQTNLVSVSAIADPVTGIVPALEVAERRAFDRLRRRDALSYGIATENVRLDADHMLVYFGADGTDGHYAQVFEGLVEVWDELAEGGPTAAEWDDLIRAHRAVLDSPQTRVGSLDNDAERHVLGMPFLARDEFLSQVAALTPEQVCDGLRTIAQTLFGIVPLEVDDGAAGWAAYQPWSEGPISGRTYSPIDGREAGTIVIGADGVSWIDDDDERARTVRWDDAVAFVWDDGTRTLLNPSGAAVVMVPWRWRGGHQFAAAVDESVDDARRIRLGEGETHYLTDPGDPESATDVRWLGSIVGARHRGAPVDVVIDTDGFFLLFGNTPGNTLEARFQHLGRSDHDTLLASDARNRWVPQSDIELVELTKSPLARLRGARRVLVVRLRDGSRLDIQLRDASGEGSARTAFRYMLGPYFQE